MERDHHGDRTSGVGDGGEIINRIIVIYQRRFRYWDVS